MSGDSCLHDHCFHQHIIPRRPFFRMAEGHNKFESDISANEKKKDVVKVADSVSLVQAMEWTKLMETSDVADPKHSIRRRQGTLQN